MMTMTTYPTTPERPVTRAEIDRLTAIIAMLREGIDRLQVVCRGYDAGADADAVTIRRLRARIGRESMRRARCPCQGLDFRAGACIIKESRVGCSGSIVRKSPFIYRKPSTLDKCGQRR